MESVYKGQRVGLKTKAAAHESDGPARCRSQPGGFRKAPRRQQPDIAIGDPVPALHVQAEEVRMQLLSLRDEMAHEYCAKLPAKQSNGMKERRKCKNPLRLS